MVGCTNGSETAISMRTFSRNSSTTRRAAVVLDDLLFAAVPAGARQGHAGHADTEQRFLHGGEPFGANDCDDEFHGTPPRRSGAGIRAR